VAVDPDMVCNAAPNNPDREGNLDSEGGDAPGPDRDGDMAPSPDGDDLASNPGDDGGEVFGHDTEEGRGVVAHLGKRQSPRLELSGGREQPGFVHGRDHPVVEGPGKLLGHSQGQIEVGPDGCGNNCPGLARQRSCPFPGPDPAGEWWACGGLGALQPQASQRKSERKELGA